MTNILVWPKATSFENISKLLLKYLNEKGIPFNGEDIDLIPSRRDKYTNVLIHAPFNRAYSTILYRFFLHSENIVYYGVTEGIPIIDYHVTKLPYKVIVPSNYVKWELERIGVRVTEVIHYGIDLTYWRKVDPYRVKRWRQLLGGEDKVIYLAVGHHYEKRKGLIELIHVWRKVKRKLTNAILVLHTQFSTPYNLFNTLPKDVLRDPHIIITDQVGFLSSEDLKSLYYASDIFIFPSLAEGFGLPIIEAMACGKPVIAIDAPPMNEHITSKDLLIKVTRQELYNFYNLLYFRLNIPDHDDYVEKIIWISDPENRRYYSNRLNDLVKKYDYKITFSRLLKHLI